MAPKRTSNAIKAPHAKKAKTAAPEAPLLAFLGTVEGLPKSGREMLQKALPFCLEVVESERHAFQVEVLDRVATILADTEVKKREAISTVEVSLAESEVEKEKVLANVASTRALASAKQSECDEQGKVVDAAKQAADEAQKALTAAQQQVEGFNAKKSAMFLEQEGFAKLLNGDFQALKEGTFTGAWQARNKVIAELKKKLTDLGAQQSLADAMAAALKLKPEQRTGSFAKVSMQLVEECFAKHTAKLAQDISGLDSEEASNKDAVAVAEAALADKKGELQQREQDWDKVQDVWVKLEDDAAEAARNSKRVELEMPDLMKSNEKAKVELEKFLELSALFAKLRAESTAAPEEPEPEAAVEAAAAAEEAAAGENPDEGMQA